MGLKRKIQIKWGPVGGVRDWIITRRARRTQLKQSFKLGTDLIRFVIVKDYSSQSVKNRLEWPRF